jgi:hypothetical protein
MDPVTMVKAALEAVFGMKTVPTPLGWTLAIIVVLVLVAGTGAAIREIAGWWPRKRRASSHDETPALGARDFLAMGPELAAEFTRAMAPIQQGRDKIIGAYNKYRPKYVMEYASNRPDKYARGQKLIRQMATEMNQQFDQMDSAVPWVETVTAKIAQSFRSMGAFARAHPDDRRGMRSVRRQIAGFRNETMERERRQSAAFQKFIQDLRSEATIDIDATGIRGTKINLRLKSAFDEIRTSCQETVKTLYGLIYFGWLYRLLRRFSR